MDSIYERRMNARAFYEKVKELRSAQRKYDYYFGESNYQDTAEHVQYWQNEKSRLEKEIDAEIERVEDILRKREESRIQIDKAIVMLNDKGFGLIKANQ